MDVRIKSRLKPLWLLALIALLTGFLWGMTPMIARAEDNSSTVPGNPTYTEDAFYYSDQYMWKVSLFVAKSDTVNKDSSNMNEFYRIGNQAVYISPVNNWNGWAAGSRPSNISGLFFSKENKVDTLMELQNKGGDVSALDPVQLASGGGVYIMTDSEVPYVPQLSDGDIYDNGVIYGDSVGNITKVAHYFSDPYKIFGLLNYYAGKQGTTREELVKNLEFTIDGETRTGWNPEGILPNVINDNPTNQVEWLIVYEPVSIVYVKDTAHPGSYYGYALSATDFAVSQIKHQMDWRYDETRWTAWAGQQPDAWKPNANRQHVSRLAFLLMGNSVITNSTWYGLAAGSGVDQNAAIPFNRWFSDQQVKYGGWGMARALKPAEYNKPRDNDFRPNTDVILSTPVYSNINATPGSELTVTYKINGEVIGTDSLVAPMKTESYSYLKWHTPDVSTVTSYDLEMSISPYPEGTINCGGNEYTHRTLTIRPLEESTPPDPKVGDTMPTDLPANLVPPTSVPGEDTADETVAPVIKSVKAVTEAPYYKNETVKIEVVTNRATKNLTFTNTDSGVGKQFGSDSLGDGMLISRSVNELSNEIVWTIEFVPANLGTNHYAFKSINAAAGESEVYAFDVEVVVDPDLPVIYDVLINPVQAVYTLYEEVVKTPLTYEVYFNTNGGNEMGAQSAEYNTLLTEPGQPTREGYSFIGWFKDPGFAYPWNFESDRIMGVTTLYAKWEINTYLVHFDPQGGSDAFSPITAEYGANIEEPAPIPTRSNYTFLGWYKDIGCNTPWNFTEDTITGDTTLYGKWDATALTVTFDSQGGSVVGSISADYNMMITSPSDPFKPGFTFKGWYQDAACNTVWTFASDRVQSDLTLFAKWDVNLYTVSFDSLGGSDVPAQTAQNESVTPKPVDPIRSGYSFGGWFKEDACINPWDFGVDTVTRDTTLFALWTADEAAIEFVTNNGTDVPKMVGATDREILDTSMPITVRDGYTFNGWFASADFSGDVVTALPDKYPMGTTIYYAKWTADPAFIEFVTNGGSDVATMTGVTDQAIAPTTMPATSRVGYTFSGWFAEADFSGTEVTALTGKYPIGTTTYHAKWTPNPAAIEFIVNGGSAVTNMTGVTDQVIADTTMPTTTRAGYTFSGWYQEPDFSGTKVTALPGQYPIGMTTYYAKWTPDPAHIEFNVNGGSDVTTMTGVTDQVIAPTTMPTTSRAGYIFSGWYRESDFSGTEVTALPGQYPIGTTTYYAKWTPNPASIEFVVNGGSPASTINGVTDQAIADTTMPTTSKTGYTFENWYENADFSGDPVTVLPSAFPVGTKTYYAKWTPIKYAVSFDSQSGSAVDSQMVDYDTLAVSPASPTQAGYTFMGWFQESSCTTPWNFATDKITQDVTLYAGWKLGIPDASVPLEYWSWEQIDQVAELGLGESYFDVGEEKNITLSTGEILTLQIYGFNHDQLADGTGNKTNITFGLKNLMDSKRDMIKAQSPKSWPNTNTYTWLSASLKNQLPESLLVILKTVNKLSHYRNSGVTYEIVTPDTLFLFSESELTGKSDKSFGPYIEGEGKQYQIFNGVTDYRKFIDENWSKTSNAGYGDNWYLRSIGSNYQTFNFVAGMSGNVSDNYPIGDSLLAGINFGFAIGNAPTNTYTVTYNSNGGSAVSNGTGTLNQLITAPTAPTKTNMTFGGWYKDAGLTEKWDFETDKITGATTLYAKWQAAITFDSQGGSVVAPVVTDTYKTFSAPASPSKDGWVFKGWFKEAGCLSAWNFAVDQPTENRTLYAKWEAGLPDASVPLENWSWDQINQVAVLGKAQDYFEVGETKNIVVNGETLTLQIYGFNHDTLADGTGNKTNITFGLKNLTSTQRYMNPNTVMNDYGWNGCDLRGWLNGCYTLLSTGSYSSESNSLFSQLPIELKSKIQYVKKDTSGGYNNQTIVASTDRLFLFSEIEVFGNNNNSIMGEGQKYKIFDNASNRNKGWWYLRSAYATSNTSFCGLDGSGNPYWYFMYNQKMNINFGFAIGNASTNTYTVNFDSQGGSAVASTTATLNTTITAPTAPTKANAIFDGWYKDAGCTLSWNFASDKVTGATTLYAKWKTLPAAGQPLSSYTWEQIGMIADEGLGDVYWDVGDTKDLTITGTNEVITMQIYGFDHDDLSDGNGKANITFGMKNVMRWSNAYNTYLYPNNNGGWKNCTIRARLNGIATLYQEIDYAGTYYNQSIFYNLPTAVKSNIKEVKKYSSNGTGSLYTTNDKLFLFSEKEVTGGNTGSLNGEGERYEIFTNTSSMIKANPEVSIGNCFWLLRSPTENYSNHLGVITPYGSYSSMSSGDAYTSFGFCMGKARDIPLAGTALKDCSWQQIANVANAGKGDEYWNIGDTKNITLSTNEILTMQIYDFDHDNKSDGSGKAGITFGTKNLMGTQQKMRTANSNTGGWTNTNLRTLLNDTVLTSMPADLKEVIKTVNKLTTQGGTISTAVATADKLFLLSEVETGLNVQSYSGEGTKYSIFSDDLSRSKSLSNGSGLESVYWLRSPKSNQTANYCVIAEDGYSASHLPTYEHGVCFAFCV
ncbi:InlB B-repeat-containing protein [Acetobacterium wieringae]|uniref:InlB B-repeat-containing protein n=1 Tax=Acetobacterium wieringae TaxID=52694 RepID=UPI0026EB104F|nr:InlB B-repeat-containing protein [Acetobacterium wieringae]